MSHVPKCLSVETKCFLQTKVNKTYVLLNGDNKIYDVNVQKVDLCIYTIVYFPVIVD